MKVKKPEKVVVIGLDAPIVTSVKKYAEGGELPYLKKLIEEGVWAENCLVPHPTITPPNWTTIVTGSWPGTHGITCFHLHKPGMALDESYQAFLSTDCKAEYIWEAAERVGKKTILLNYPSTWPPTLKEGIQIGGAGLHINEWRITLEGEGTPWGGERNTLADEELLTTEELPLAERVEFKEAKGWKNLPPAKKALEAEVKIGHRNQFFKMKPKTYYLLIQDSQGRGFDRVSLSPERDGEKIFFTLQKMREWSPKITDVFETERGEKEAVFMAKLLKLSPDGEYFRLYLTPLACFSEWSYPEHIAEELKTLDGLPFKAMQLGLHLEWYGVETWLELCDLENRWLGEAAKYLLKKYPWDLFFMHAHTPDHSYHGFINKIEPLTCRDKEELKRFQKAELKFYQSLDRMIGKILEATDKKTLVFVVSDHGATPTDPELEGLSVNKILEKAGLLVYKEDEEGNRTVDWKKTKAVSQRSVYIYVNLKGRDPEGIVEPEEYEKVREEIINALYNYTDPKTGKKPISFVFKKEEARILGLYGERIGDVVFGVRPEVSGEHGRHITTGEYGIGSMKGLLIIAGPNIKRGYKLERTVWLTDIVPTICYLMDLPIPKDTEGAIIYQVLEDPDFKIKEMETLRKNYQRLRQALEAQKALTHLY